MKEEDECNIKPPLLSVRDNKFTNPFMGNNVVIYVGQIFLNGRKDGQCKFRLSKKVSKILDGLNIIRLKISVDEKECEAIYHRGHITFNAEVRNEEAEVVILGTV